MARSEYDWLELVRASVSRSDFVSARASVNQALAEFPDSLELRRAFAGILQQIGLARYAEQILYELLIHNPDDAASAFSLAHMLKEQGRMAAAAKILRACLSTEHNRHNAELVIASIELLVDCDRQHDAAAIAENMLTLKANDPRLHAYAGMLAIQLGEFTRARERYLFALHHDPRAYEWHVPIGLSSTLRYTDPTHSDLAWFLTGLQRDDLSGLARAELHFALGKASDDLGDYAEATRHFRLGNDIRHRTVKWSRKTWRRTIEARLAYDCSINPATTTKGFTPLFIVGMPRTGTTLLAELLSRYSNVCNRGELPWLARLARQPHLSGLPNRPALQHAASCYVLQARQDDAPNVRWFLDKQPLNFRYIDLALAMFPDAKIIHCQRNPRDTALSIWMQCFFEEVQGYSYDFNDIALVMRDEQRLMAHWCKLYPDSVRTVRYEELVAMPQTETAKLATWIGLATTSSPAPSACKKPINAIINTASLWQARQPIHGNSVNRWQYYAPYIHELSRFPHG